jgi:hypothetical protein
MTAQHHPYQQRAHSTDDSEKGGHMINEPDIGSGEKSPGEKETDEQIRQIPQRTPEPPKENQ